MVKSVTLRRVTVTASFAAVMATAILWSDTIPLSGMEARAAKLIGALALFALTALAYAIHASYPERHDEPGDFSQLLTEGPYSLCRHPFYLLLILIQFSIALYYLSLQAATAAAAFLPMWYALMRAEEKDLLAHFGNRYREYIERVPMVVPLGRKAKRSQGRP